MNLKAKYLLLILVLTFTLLLAACGENTSSYTAPGSNGSPTTTASVTPAANGNGSSATVAANTPSNQPTTKAESSGEASGDEIGKIEVCELFSQADAETTLGEKVERTPTQDSVAFYTCYYSTQDDGSLKIEDVSRLSVNVFTHEVTPGWYASVKKGYQELSSDQKLNQVEGVGSEAFSFLVTDHFSDKKAVHLGVLKDKYFFTISVNNPKLGEEEQTARLKDLALKIIAKLN